MSIEKPNRLANETSPYLRSAVHQPVDWYPWCEEAFKKARELDRPLLLDVGAVWCHWCHVIDRESYEDEEIARIINQNFIAIKVDRDERPDIDRRYQQAVSAITGQGGWPLTAFLTPEGKVFFGGTYFPPKDSQNLPSFRTILNRVTEYYKNNREKVIDESSRIFQALSQINELEPSAEEPNILSVDKAVDSMFSLFDPVNGGFGGAPKFPHYGVIELFLARHFETKDEELLNVVEKTLTEMAEGGIHDQIGGGFHRYSVDAQWIVPHFEKMSYDNSEHLKNYLLAYQATGNEFYRRTAEGIIRFVADVLSDYRRGGFHGSQDADIDPQDDGDYFTWTKEEVKEALSPDEARVISFYYNVFSRGEMRHNPARNVLFIDMYPEKIAEKLALSSDKVRELIESGRKKLIEARKRRPAPYVDKTLYANWNGMMISSFLQAYKILGDEKVRDSALKALDLLLQDCFRYESGFCHVQVNGDAKLNGLLDDQVKMGLACLDAYEVSGRIDYLETAMRVATIMAERFWDRERGGFFDVEEGTGPVLTLKSRIKPIQDDPIPSSNSSAILLFDKLFYLTDDHGYRKYAQGTLKYFARVAEKYGLYAASYFLALHHHLKHPPQVVVLGDSHDPRVRELLRASWSYYRPHKLVIQIDPAKTKVEILSPTIREIAKLKPPCACLCAGISCAEPTDDPSALAKTIKTFGVR
ncbi:MAG TPA: thioredoxin domain-containing protein [Thermodesulfobacteriota bacterium]|nr:thioredoxin domain-containing protein [Thermodesulfobacteriota bacterium]